MLRLYKDEYGRRFIAKPDHVRVRNALQCYADALGEPCAQLMRTALQSDLPSGGGAEEAMRHFGTALEEKGALVRPVLEAVEGILPGFKVWLEVTRFGDDKFMILALLAFANKLAALPKPLGARSRPAKIRLPKFH